MISIVIILHVLADITLTIFVKSYYSTIYKSSTEACIDFGRCRISNKLYEENCQRSNENVTNSSGILLINGLPHTAIDLSKLIGLEDSDLLSHLCPAEKCKGDDFCCHVCQDYPSPLWHLIDLELKDILVVKDQPIVLLSCISVTVLLLIGTWILSYIQLIVLLKRQDKKYDREEDGNENTTITRTTTTKRLKLPGDEMKAGSVTYRKKQQEKVKGNETDKHNDNNESAIILETATKTIKAQKKQPCSMKYNKISISITVFVVVSFLLLVGTITESFIICMYDFDFYKRCHTDLVVIISWMLTEILLCLDMIFVQWPKIAPYAKRKNNKLKTWRLENKVMKICSRIINWIARISLLYIPAAITYLIGVGEGRWNIIS